MKKHSGNIISFFLLFVAVILTGITAAIPQTLTCGTNGNFGTSDTQATISGPNNMVMHSSTGVITCPGVAVCPATGTPITCQLTGAGDRQTYAVYCDASRTIANPAGCCGTTNRNMTGFTVSAAGAGKDINDAACKGLGTSVGSLKSSKTGIIDFTLGGTMDITHVKIGGTYQLSNHATGLLNLQVVKSGVTTGPATPNFSAAFNGLMSISGSGDMSFGTISIASGPLDGSTHADLGTNNTVAYVGNFSSGGGVLTSGYVSMNNVQNGVTVEVYCDTEATMTNGTGSSIKVTGVKAAAEGSTGTYAAAGSICNGLGGAAATTMSYTLTTQDQFFFGGVLDGGTTASFVANGSYSTANAGGDDLSVTVLNQ